MANFEVEVTGSLDLSLNVTDKEIMSKKKTKKTKY
jgi:hypothetical protein